MDPHVRPAGTVLVRLTVPLNPLTAVIVIVEVAGVPTLAVGELAVMVKSTKLKVAVAVWTSELLVPVTVRTYAPAVEELHDTVAVPDPVTLVGVIAAQVRPDGAVSVSVTVPVKPLIATAVIVEVADWPTSTAPGEDAAIVKSTKLNVAVALWVRVPLVPVTVKT